MRIRIVVLIKVMQICEYWSTDPPGLHFEPPRLRCERPLPSTAPFEPLKLLNFDFYMPIRIQLFTLMTDPDPAVKNYVDPCGTLLKSET